MLKIAIAEDEGIYLRYLEEQVRQFYADKQIPVALELFANSELLYFDVAERAKYDLYILDIDMPRVSGLKLAEKIREYDKDAYILFVTAHHKFSIVGYEYQIYRYIPKNLVKDKLLPALESLTAEFLLKDTGNYLISTESRYIKIPYSTIIYIYKEGKNAVFLCDDQSCKVRKSLKEVHSEIDRRQFIFIERGFIVNIIKIAKVAGGEIHLTGGERLRIGSSYINEVKQAVALFWGGRQ
ncbi:MAG: LytTR family DNA-binding domain-containing protein [Lachnospiraceae bacterium]|jgi:DNA-binding LytR/AlgR family response regulator|nr:LytTR family DNA-binding domain-containing protein [Lachnospiraceae bacterium]